jgi:hypothetical protein
MIPKNTDIEYLLYALLLFFLIFFAFQLIKFIINKMLKFENRFFNILYLCFSILAAFYLSTVGANFALQFDGKLNTANLQKAVTDYLDSNGLSNAWDITIVAPKKIPRGNNSTIIIFYNIGGIDYRSYVNATLVNSTYKLAKIKTEKNTSRYVAVPRKHVSIWIEVKDRMYPFKGIERLKLKCQLVDNKYFEPASPNDKVILTNSHIEKIEPYLDGKVYRIRIYLTSEGTQILNDIAKNDYKKKLGLKIGFVSYTTQAIAQNHNYKWITINTNYSLENTKDVIKGLLKEKAKI